MKKLLLILLCLPMIFSCNKENKKTNKKTKNKVECKDDNCFIGTWDIYVNKELIGIFIIQENGMIDCEDTFDHILLNFTKENSEEYEEYKEALAAPAPKFNWYGGREDGQFCIDIWIPNTVIGGLDNIGAKCYKSKWKNENNFILTKKDGSELEYRRKVKKKKK